MNEMIELDDARDRILQRLQPLPAVETIGVTDALQRVLAQDVSAPGSIPPFASSAMDGYAVRSGDPALEAPAGLAVVDESRAGHPAAASCGHGEAIRIFTGAPLPAGADAVVAQEDVERVDGGRIRAAVRDARTAFVRPAGGDVTAGATLVRAGTVLDARHIALLAAAGVTSVNSRRPPRVALMTTGDELRTPGEPLAPGQIHDANGWALRALLEHWSIPCGRIIRAPDDPDALRATMTTLAGEHDVIIASGGVSVGDADHVRDVLEREGEVAFWRLALKPGKPFTFGSFGGAWFFGLPGNPVSTFVTALLLVRPALQRLAGCTPGVPERLAARLGAPVDKAPGRRDFQRGHMWITDDGELQVTAAPRQDSNLLSVLVGADCLIDLPRDSGRLDAGARVEVLPLDRLLAWP